MFFEKADETGFVKRRCCFLSVASRYDGSSRRGVKFRQNERVGWITKSPEQVPRDWGRRLYSLQALTNASKPL